VIPTSGAFGTLLTEELLDLGDEIAGWGQLIRPPASSSSSGFFRSSLATYSGNLRVLGHHAVQVLLELFRGLRQLGQVGLGVDQQQTRRISARPPWDSRMPET
jgi:hypothetical protein